MKQQYTQADMVEAAGFLYSKAPVFNKIMQGLRPYICPFEDLVEATPTGSNVLDIGCGSGLFLGLLAFCGRLHSGIGFDSSQAAIQVADLMQLRLTTSADLSFRVLDATQDWPAGQYDVVSMVDVIHHVPPRDQASVIQRALSRVKPGGLFLYKDMVSTPAWRSIGNRLHDLVMAREWIHYYPVTEVERIAANIGFRLEVSKNSNRLWYGHELRVFSRQPDK